MRTPRLYLASGSPRRLQLLREIGLDPQPLPPGVDERLLPDEAPREHVLRLSRAKAEAGAARLGGGAAPGVILAADTAVIIDGRVLGKPADDADARAMLRSLRGRTHEVLTGVHLLRIDDGRTAGGVERSRVRFRDFDDLALEAYVTSGEPLDKAGAYGLQGRGALLVERVQGSWSNVVGLPLERLPEWMERLGLGLARLLTWRDPAPGG
jgi:septum formation protein